MSDREPNETDTVDTVDTAAAGSAGIRPRVVGLRPSAERSRTKLGRTAHRRFQPAAPPYPDWTSFAAKRHVRDVAVGADGLRVWLATWGGVLCWTPGDGRVERHGSDHGLVGNTARTVAVDRAGIIWVGQEAGLCSLDLNAGDGWRQPADLLGWTVTHVRARPAGGVYVALTNAVGRGAIGEIAAPDAPLRIRLQSHRACEDITALVPAADGTLWLGNAWGVFHDQGAAAPLQYDLSVDDEGKRAVQQQVRSLAIADDGTLWVGTTWGLYRLRPAERPQHEAVASVRGVIRSLSIDATRDHLLVLTDDSVGTWNGVEWRPTHTGTLGAQHVVASASIEGAGRAWVGGADGLHEIISARLIEAFPMSTEDALANAVNAVAAGAGDAWVGTARGMFRYADEWRPVEGDGAEPGERAPVRWDVRDLANAPQQQAMWAATWDQGLCNFAEGVYIPGANSATPVVAATAAADGAIWFATPDAIYQSRAGEIHAQRRLTLPETAGVIRTLCHQHAGGAGIAGGAPTPILWIGTATGLLACRPDLQLWEDTPEALRDVPVNALAVDPRDGSLWVGTSAGLFSEHQWSRRIDKEVRALTFGVLPDESLWIGTPTALEQWQVLTSPAGVDIKLIARWTAANSGLAADAVTALSVRSIEGRCELWAGSRSGISHYRYDPLRAP